MDIGVHGATTTSLAGTDLASQRNQTGGVPGRGLYLCGEIHGVLEDGREEMSGDKDGKGAGVDGANQSQVPSPACQRQRPSLLDCFHLILWLHQDHHQIECRRVLLQIHGRPTVPLRLVILILRPPAHRRTLHRQVYHHTLHHRLPPLTNQRL